MYAECRAVPTARSRLIALPPSQPLHTAYLTTRARLTFILRLLQFLQPARDFLCDLRDLLAIPGLSLSEVCIGDMYLPRTGLKKGERGGGVNLKASGSSEAQHNEAHITDNVIKLSLPISPKCDAT